MTAFPSGVHVWLATGHTDMRKGFGSLALLVQETLTRDPNAGDLYVFRGRRGDLLKIICRDGTIAPATTIGRAKIAPFDLP
jgi:transposase